MPDLGRGLLFVPQTDPPQDHPGEEDPPVRWYARKGGPATAAQRRAAKEACDAERARTPHDWRTAIKPPSHDCVTGIKQPGLADDCTFCLNHAVEAWAQAEHDAQKARGEHDF